MSELQITDTKMLEAINLLKAQDNVFKAEIYRVIDFIPQNERNVKLGLQHFTAENIRMFCVEYGVNPNYIFGLSSEMFSVNKKVNKLRKAERITQK